MTSFSSPLFFQPFYNVEHTGIIAKRLEAMESSLKNDVLNESRLFGGKILLHDEDDDGYMHMFPTLDVLPKIVCEFLNILLMASSEPVFVCTVSRVCA